MDRLKEIKDRLRDRIKRIYFGRDTVIFLFFLALSSLFWLVNQLGKDTTAVLLSPVTFKNDVPDRVVLNDLPDHLTLQVKGQGYTLMKYKLRPRLLSLVVDLRAYPLRPLKTGNNRDFYLLTSYLRGIVNDQIGQNIVVTGIRPDTLYFVFDTLVRRMLPVVPDMKITLARQFILKEPVHVSPGKVTVTGPAVILDTLGKITTEHVEFTEVADSFVKIVPVRQVKRVDIPVKKVRIRVQVEQFTEAEVEIPIEKINVPDSVRLVLFPSKVKVTFHVGLSRYNKVFPELFTARADYRDVINDRSGKIRVDLVKKPDYIEFIRLDPGRVDYLIEKVQ